jgi:integrase
MAIWKRHWETSKGETREAWVIEYKDGNGRRHLETFKKKKDADARQAEVKVDVRAGTHVAPSQSVTVAIAAEAWLKAGEAAGLERSTIEQYKQHVEQHIVPLIGRLKLSEVTVPIIRKFEDRLREEPNTQGNKRSPAMVRKVRASLGAILADAVEQGQAARNPVRELRRNRRRGKERHAIQRQRGKLEIGVDVPKPAEVRAMVDSAKGSRWRPLLMTAAFTGLRASELRGLRWQDVDFKASELHVRQRADRFNAIGAPKSESSTRTVPLPKLVANTLKEWRLACPKGELDLVFPNGLGKVESLANIINRGLIPAQPSPAKYTGMHCLRHFYASWCINRIEEGGLGMPPKNVQERLGHATINMTLDRYGHLFKVADASELDAAVNALMA